jgi:rhodanese-related sulfurtransferase/DNA-binding HxlR family transcriptional regulator
MEHGTNLMADRAAKDELFAAFAWVASALGNGRRVEIVDVLAQGERSVEELARQLDQSMSNTSQHLRRLATAGLVRSRRVGHEVRYRLTSDRVGELWSALRGVAAEHLADVEVLARAYLGDPAGVERVCADELAQRLADGRAVVLDVRPRAEYAAGHIAGARSVPIDELERVVDELPADREIVAYCRGPYCVYADDAVRLLRRRGVDARRLDEGFPEWRRAGLPVELPAS